MLAPYFIFCICSSFPHPFSGHFTSASLYLSYKLLAALWWYVFICPLVTWFKYLFLLLYTFFFLHLLVTTDKQFFFLFFFFFQQTVSDSYAHHSSCPRAISTRHGRNKLLSPFSLRPWWTWVSFVFSFFSFVILSCLNYWSCSGRSPSPPSFYSSFTPLFHPFVCFHFFSSHCQLPVSISVILAISFAPFHHLSSLSIRII